MIRFSGEHHIATQILPDLLAAFAELHGLDFSLDAQAERQEDWAHFTFRDMGKLKARISIHATTTAEGFADLISETSDIALATRPPRPVEVTMSQSAGAGDLGLGRRAYVIGLDAITLRLSDPKQSLTLTELTQILNGTLRDWSELDSEAGEITFDLPETGSSVLSSLLQRFQPVQTGTAESGESADIKFQSYQEVLPGAEIETACGFGISPSDVTIRTQDYPLSVPLIMHTPARRLPQITRDFLGFVTSPQANEIVREAGFPSQEVGIVPLDANGTRLANAIANAGGDVGLNDLKRLVVTLGTRRLSTTFRFQDGSTSLDLVSRDTLARLAAEIGTGRFDGHTLILAGFSDLDGDPEDNLERSGVLAQRVRDELASFGPFAEVSFQVEAFGETLPILCEETEWASKTNRRVEIWLK